MTTIKDMTIDDAIKHLFCFIEEIETVRQKLLADGYEVDYDINDIPETTWKAVERRLRGKYTVRYLGAASPVNRAWVYVSDDSSDEDLTDYDSVYSSYATLDEAEKDWREFLDYATNEKPMDYWNKINLAKQVLDAIEVMKRKN